MKNSDNIIDIEGLEFCWQADGQPILNIDSFQVKRGERLFIKGASGSGKSTLLNLLGGVMTPQHGDIRVLGKTLNKLHGAQRDVFRADHIGFIFQMFNLIPYLSMIENVILPLRFSKSRNRRVAERSSPRQEAARLLAQLDLDEHELHHRAVTELSVGQQQRVAAARALIGSPEIIIADEPTSSLDADRREAFINLLISECEEVGSTLLFVSHDSTLERYFDHTIALDRINSAAHSNSSQANEG